MGLGRNRERRMFAVALRKCSRPWTVARRGLDSDQFICFEKMSLDPVQDTLGALPPARSSASYLSSPASS
jgi:hypothetical protein